ncbi:MAG TPA: beta-N-acetylhexosaminidase [Bacillota bacterium]|nr:beta-N-acetylhexosaminidase [Bacillota bacterium]
MGRQAALTAEAGHLEAVKVVRRGVLVALAGGLLLLALLLRLAVVDIKAREPYRAPISERDISRLTETMTLEQKVGQLMLVGLKGYEADDAVKEMIRARHVGGIILFKKNIRDTAQVKNLIAGLQGFAADTGNLPLFMAVDQEWGPVNRFKAGLTEFPGPKLMGKRATASLASTAARDTAEEIKSLGFNINFAPVLDLAYDDGVMCSRSYGNRPETVTNLGAAATAGTQAGGIIAAAKHFPGLGRGLTDLHKGPVEIAASASALEASDLVPFAEAVRQKVPMVMLSSAIYTELDHRQPACISPPIVQGLLRQKLGYQGVIITDDLEMKATLASDTVGGLAVRAIAAGSDIILVCHSPEQQKQAYEALLTACQTKQISEERLDESVRRILKLKCEYKVGADIKPDSTAKAGKLEEHKRDAEQIWAKVKAVE